MNKLINIFIAVDQPIFLSWVKMILDQEKDIRLIDHARDGHESLTKIRNLKPDLSILDCGLPMINGLEIAQRILSQNPDERIILLSEFHHQITIEKARQIGVLGLILKDSKEEILLGAIQTVLEGKKYFITDHLESQNL